MQIRFIHRRFTHSHYFFNLSSETKLLKSKLYWLAYFDLRVFCRLKYWFLSPCSFVIVLFSRLLFVIFERVLRKKFCIESVGVFHFYKFSWFLPEIWYGDLNIGIEQTQKFLLRFIKMFRSEVFCYWSE